jgi:hypothetical protein
MAKAEQAADAAMRELREVTDWIDQAATEVREQAEGPAELAAASNEGAAGSTHLDRAGQFVVPARHLAQTARCGLAALLVPGQHGTNRGQLATSTPPLSPG